jgi:hypothetical protein
VAKALLGGWQVNSIVTLAAGTPFTVSTGRDTLLNFQSARANVSGDPTLSPNRSQAELIARYFDPAVRLGGWWLVVEVGGAGSIGYWLPPTTNHLLEQQFLHPPAGELTDIELVLCTAVDPVHGAEFL